MNTQLFFDNKTGLYYFNGEPFCYHCDSKILDQEALFVIFHPKYHTSYGCLFCRYCIEKAGKAAKNVLLASEIFIVSLSNIPETAFAVPIFRMEFKKHLGVTTFDAALSNKGLTSDSSSCVVTDKTKLSFRESWKDARIGVSPSELPKKDNLLDDKEINKFLLDYQNDWNNNE